MRTVQRSIPLMLVVVLMAACGQQTPQSPPVEGAGLVATATPEPPGLMPDWFLQEFPPPPDGAQFLDASRSENAVVKQHHTEQPTPNEEKGTVTSRGVTFSYGTGTVADLDEVLDHYRTTLPDTGWQITSEEELDPEQRPDLEHPGARLIFDADGHRGTVTASQRGDHIRLSLGVFEEHYARAPYSHHPPLLELPQWYEYLPEPPRPIRRSSIDVQYPQTLTAANYRIAYVDYQLAGSEGDAAAVADHYRRPLQQAGWQITDENQHSEREELPHTTTQRDQVTLDITGHGVTGQILVTQHSWAEGEWQPAAVTVVIDG